MMKFLLITFSQTVGGRALSATTVYYGSVGEFLIKLLKENPDSMSKIYYSTNITEKEFYELSTLL